MKAINLYGLTLPEINAGDDLSELIVEAAKRSGIDLENGDVVVIASKVVSKALGLVREVDGVKPGKRAGKIAKKAGVDARIVQLILEESDKLLFAIPVKKLVEKGVLDISKMSRDVERGYSALNLYPTVLIVERDKQLWSEAGIDQSNHPMGCCSIPPRSLDVVAKQLAEKIAEKTGKKVAVVVSDTELMPFGSLDFARGAYGILPVSRKFGEYDAYGKPKFGGLDHIAHEICCAAALLMGQCAESIPAVIVRGLEYAWFEGGLSDCALASLDKMGKAAVETLKATVKVFGLKHALKLLLSIVF